MNCSTYSSSITLSKQNNKSMSVNSSNFTFFHLKVACHANPGSEINFTGSDS